MHLGGTRQVALKGCCTLHPATWNAGRQWPVVMLDSLRRLNDYENDLQEEEEGARMDTASAARAVAAPLAWPGCCAAPDLFGNCIEKARLAAVPRTRWPWPKVMPALRAERRAHHFAVRPRWPVWFPARLRAGPLAIRSAGAHERKHMSLNVPTDLLERAEAGQVPYAEFVDCVRESLPYAWSVISEVAAELHSDGGEFADHAVPPPSEAERGQLLRALASDAIRGGLERHFGVKLAFQNCHRVAAFRISAVGGRQYQEFISPRGQLLNQSPQLRDC